MSQELFLIRTRRARSGILFALTTFSLWAAGVIVAAEKLNVDDLLSQAKAAYGSGKHDQAMMLVTQAIEAEPKSSRSYFVRARFHQENREPAKAVADYDQVLKRDPRATEAWQQRGGEHFKLGRIKESIADFDQFIALAPQQAPYHWQRGIAYYYAGQFENGRKQFELHQTVNPNDVENAVWHFLCVARAAGLEKARTALIPIKNDERKPMMEVHALFAGKAKPEDVLKAAAAGGSPKSQLEQQLFYAHLYLGLYFEVIGDEAQARDHILKAARQYQTKDYMGDVARVHLQLKWPKENSSARERK